MEEEGGDNGQCEDVVVWGRGMSAQGSSTDALRAQIVAATVTHSF